MYNKKQLEAINSLEGRIRVIACAGSGKTATLTQRYVKLVESGINPENILCVTFTNKAADEMKKRITKSLGERDYGLICTFHSFCLRLLRIHGQELGLQSNFAVLDGEDQNTLLKNVYRDNGIDYKETSYKVAKDIVTHLKTTKELNILDLFTGEDVIKDLYIDAKQQYRLTQDKNDLGYLIYYGYLYYQQKSAGVDFNDMIILACMLLKDNPKILEKWQNKLKHVMVDEFQDSSKRQYELVTMLTDKSNNLFVVGDPDQTIYSWRGAVPEILVNFDKEKQTKTIILDQNYRSTPNILRAANEIISKNKMRIVKDLYTENPEGRNVTHRNFPHPKAEAEWIAKCIQETLKVRKPKDIVILYRMHFLSKNIEEQLIKFKIPYVIHSGVNFYERKEIKDVLSYLKAINNLHDDIALERIINVPTRGIGAKTIKDLKQYAEINSCSLWNACNHFIQKDTKGKLTNFVMLMRYLKSKENEHIFDLTKEILDKSGYSESLQKGLEPEREENVQELLLGMKETDKNLSEYLQEIALLTSTDQQEKDRVTLMTIHSAKGLEYPVVFIIGMSEGQFPSSFSNETIETQEEERRLAYVAFTRAKESLILTDVSGLDYNGNERKTSRFIREINSKDLDTGKKPTEKAKFFRPQKFRSNTSCNDGYAQCPNPKGQYFDSKGNYYDWDDDTYLQGSITAEDIFDASDFC